MLTSACEHAIVPGVLKLGVARVATLVEPAASAPATTALAGLVTAALGTRGGCSGSRLRRCCLCVHSAWNQGHHVRKTRGASIFQAIQIAVFLVSPRIV